MVFLIHNEFYINPERLHVFSNCISSKQYNIEVSIGKHCITLTSVGDSNLADYIVAFFSRKLFKAIKNKETICMDLRNEIHTIISNYNKNKQKGENNEKNKEKT